jgi:hypothetical protein
MLQNQIKSSKFTNIRIPICKEKWRLASGFGDLGIEPTLISLSGSAASRRVYKISTS